MITRTEPALIKDPIGRGMQLFCQDYSFIGDQIEFLSIDKGLIYFKVHCFLAVKMLGSGILSIPLEEFSDGWEYWSEYKPEEDEKQIFKTDIKKRMKPDCS